jgi:deoxyribonuclease-4
LRRLHIHLSGIAYGPRGERKHLQLIDSDLDLVQLLGALAQTGCAGRILCESPILEDDALLIQRAWDHIAAA